MVTFFLSASSQTNLISSLKRLKTGPECSSRDIQCGHGHFRVSHSEGPKGPAGYGPSHGGGRPRGLIVRVGAAPCFWRSSLHFTKAQCGGSNRIGAYNFIRKCAIRTPLWSFLKSLFDSVFRSRFETIMCGWSTVDKESARKFWLRDSKSLELSLPKIT